MFSLFLTVFYAVFIGILHVYSIELSLNTSKIHHLETVRVFFNGIAAEDRDLLWFGVFYPASATVSTIASVKYSHSPWVQPYPLKWIYCNNITSCMDNGSGFVDIQMENLFEDAKISVFKNGIDAPVFIGIYLIIVSFY